MRTLGLYSLLAHRRELPARYDTVALARRLLTLARDLRDRADSSAYGVPMVRQNFVWGSNAIAANQGIVLLHAFRLSGDSSYLRVAVATVDYLLGRNATGYSFEVAINWNAPLTYLLAAVEAIYGGP